MTDALTRAARAIHEKHTWLSRSEANDAARALCQNAARAALLAFLDASDEAMVEKVAQIIATTIVSAYSNPTIWAEDVEMFRRSYARSDTPSPHNPIATARAAIAALREMLEGEK